MKLKESTFAIIAEKKDSVSHKWFRKNAKCNSGWMFIGEHYIYDKGTKGGILREKPKGIPIYTESEFEALLKAEQEAEKQTYKKLDEIIVPQITELNQFKADNPNATKKQIDKKLWDLAKKYTNTLLTQKKAEQENEAKEITQEFKDKFTGGVNEAYEACRESFQPLTEMPTWSKTVGLNDPKQITISYNLALEYLAERLNVDKGIIKIEMP